MFPPGRITCMVYHMARPKRYSKYLNIPVTERMHTLVRNISTGRDMDMATLLREYVHAGLVRDMVRLGLDTRTLLNDPEMET